MPSRGRCKTRENGLQPRPTADPLGLLRVRVSVRKRHAVPDDHDRVDRAGFNPRAVTFETDCCAAASPAASASRVVVRLRGRAVRLCSSATSVQG